MNVIKKNKIINAGLLWMFALTATLLIWPPYAESTNLLSERPYESYVVAAKIISQPSKDTNMAGDKDRRSEIQRRYVAADEKCLDFEREVERYKRKSKKARKKCLEAKRWYKERLDYLLQHINRYGERNTRAVEKGVKIAEEEWDEACQEARYVKDNLEDAKDDRDDACN